MIVLVAAPGGYAIALVQSIVALAGVCALAVFMLRLAAGRGIGRGPRGEGRALELVERLPLDARSAVCLVRAGGRSYLLGTAEGAAPTLVAVIEGGAEAEGRGRVGESCT